MATIEQQIEVAEDPTSARSTWGRFIQWAHIGPGRLLCSELACVDAMRQGLVDFVPSRSGRTIVVFRVEAAEKGLSTEELEQRVGHDLVMFKDYIERTRPVRRKTWETEETAIDLEAAHRGDRPRHTRLSSEGDTTFWRSHFPT